ncbi:MAG: M12 family metallopeptidase [Saprospiraceae bacterium]|nr:M12 family metallopeptidase [Saprospiraceae bacterium]
MNRFWLCAWLCGVGLTPLAAQENETFHICTEIILDAPENELPSLPPGLTARAVGFRPEIGKYWPNGKVLKVRFLGGTEAERAKVRKYAVEWSDVANIRFLYVEKGPSDLRVSFSPGLGTWSLIGTDASRMPQNKPTINFGWINSRTPESDYRAAILHEFGHVLGLLHEHQHPNGGIPWDKSKLYAYYQRTQGWEPERVDEQVLSRLNSTRTQYTRYDPASIMHYPIPNALTVGDFEVGENNDLSPTDRAFVAKVYPKKSVGAVTPGVIASPPPAQVDATLTIRDELAVGQKREQVWLTINGVTRSFTLDQTGQRAAQISFTLPKAGPCDYEIYTKTTFLRRVDGVLKEVQRQGYGSGRLNVRGQLAFDLVMGNVIRDGYFEVKLVAGQVASR